MILKNYDLLKFKNFGQDLRLFFSHVINLGFAITGNFIWFPVIKDVKKYSMNGDFHDSYSLIDKERRLLFSIVLNFFLFFGIKKILFL